MPEKSKLYSFNENLSVLLDWKRFLFIECTFQGKQHEGPYFCTFLYAGIYCSLNDMLKKETSALLINLPSS